ncbi:MAG: sigma-70 family RNA polymerase sigma factor [Ignavibacteria bacterium]|nr:sigma-70 family RNA polymerase sigma factor [Ignavibacteria bacterium]
MKTNLKEITKEIKEGDLTGFKTLVEAFKDKAFSLCMKILKEKNESEDALQDSFIKLYNSIQSGQFEEKSSLSTYFYRIVYNTAIEYYRKYRAKNFNIVSFEVNESSFREGDELTRNLNIITRKTGNTSSTENDVTLDEVNGIINEYLNSLPEHYSVILTMFYINELSINEISEILRIPSGTIKSRIFRAREKLKEILLSNFRKEELLEYVLN